MKIRVYYEDTDCGGVVYHSNYLNFCERARSEIFFQKGLSPHNEQNFFVVKKIDANYMFSAKLGDTLKVITNLIKIKKASMIMEQIITNQNKKTVFKQIVTVAYLSNGKLAKIPKELLTIFN